jgi:hypothetical protein
MSELTLGEYLPNRREWKVLLVWKIVLGSRPCHVDFGLLNGSLGREEWVIPTLGEE